MAASVVATPAAAATAWKLGVVDHPGPLKPQAAPVPYLGGIGVLAGTAVGLASTQPVQLIPLGLATALGTVDDCMNLSPKARVLGADRDWDRLGRHRGEEVSPTCKRRSGRGLGVRPHERDEPR